MANIKAMANLGIMYLKSKKKVQEALHLLTMAAANENAPAAAVLADYYAHNQSEPDAESSSMSWTVTAAKLGNPESQYVLSKALWDTGLFEPALYWLLNAAAGGHADAQFKLAHVLEVGDMGLPRDLKRSFRWAIAAARKGHIKAIEKIGLCYLNGKGIAKPDRKKAVEWFLKAKDYSAQCSNNAAYFMMEDGADLDFAEELARTAVEKEPMDPKYHDTLGAILTKKKMYDEALTHCEFSASNSKNETHYRSLAELYRLLGRSKDCEDTLAKIKTI